MENRTFERSAWKSLDCRILRQIPKGFLSQNPGRIEGTPHWKFLLTGLVY